MIAELLQIYPGSCEVACKQGWFPLHIAVSVKRVEYSEGEGEKTDGGYTPLSLAKRYDCPVGDSFQALLSILSSSFESIEVILVNTFAAERLDVVFD